MNARIPLYAGPTSNPCADAERWANQVEHQEMVLEDRKKSAYQAVLNALSVSAQAWCKWEHIGGLYTSPDELLHEARIEAEDPEVTRLYNELMASPAAKELREAVAAYHGDSCPWMGDQE